MHSPRGCSAATRWCRITRSASRPSLDATRCSGIQLSCNRFRRSVRKRGRGEGLRWLSPTTELTLCGHATLASAHILGGAQVFHTRSGLLACSVGSSGAISMTFPADPVNPEPPCAELSAGLPGITLRSIWRGRMDVLVEVASAAEVRRLRPDLAALATVAARAVIVSAKGDGIADIVSRVFAPGSGIAEDPPPDRRTARWPAFGRPDWESRSCSPNKPHFAAGYCEHGSWAAMSNSPATRLPFAAANFTLEPLFRHVRVRALLCQPCGALRPESNGDRAKDLRAGNACSEGKFGGEPRARPVGLDVHLADVVTKWQPG